jgi:hypothetical protein
MRTGNKNLISGYMATPIINDAPSQTQGTGTGYMFRPREKEREI